MKDSKTPCPCDGWCSNSVGGAWKTEKTHCPRCGEALPPERAFDVCMPCEAAMAKEFPSE